MLCASGVVEVFLFPGFDICGVCSIFVFVVGMVDVTIFDYMAWFSWVCVEFVGTLSSTCV